MTATTPDLPDFDDMGDWLLSLGTQVSPSELHGLLCGQIAGALAPNARQWLAVAAEVLDVEVFPATTPAAGLERLRAATLQQFGAADFELQLLLPPEDARLQERLDSLGCWCQGFLAGYALAGNSEQQLRQMPEVCAEILSDMVEIGRIDADVEDDEAVEREYMEVCEYLRMGAMQIFLELNPAPPTLPDGKSTVH